MDIIQHILSTLMGLVMVGGLVAFIYMRDAVDWKKLQAAYGRAWTPPIEQKRFQTMILYSEGRMAKSYKGLLTIGLYPDGIGIRPFIWLVPFQTPIFVPYTDIEGWKQKWFVDGKSTELAFRETSAMRIIMPSEQVEWMLSKAPGHISISQDRPPHGSWPWASFITAVMGGLMAVFLIVLLVSKHFNLELL